MTPRELARLATEIEKGGPLPADLPEGSGLVVGITGAPGAGKSTLAAALTAEFRLRGKTVAVVAIDPSSKATGGAILGDRVRMQAHHGDAGVFVRSMAARGAQGGLARATENMTRLFRGAGFDFVLVETVGAGQSEIDIASHADVTLVVLVPGMGDGVQTIKAGVMEIADIFVLNKSDRPGADQTENEISSLLPDVPVMRTVATEGTGIAALADAVISRPRRTPVTRDPTWRIDHIGIAVKSIDEALAFYSGQLGMKLLGRETVAHEQVHVAMLDAGPSRIELLEAMSPDCATARFIENRGPGLHHVAMRVADLNSVIARLKSEGAKLLAEPQRGAGGHVYVFVHPRSTGGVLWEIIQA